MALVLGRAGDGIRAGAGAQLAGVGLSTQAAIAAGSPVTELGVGALSGERIADSRFVARVEGRADHGIGPLALPLLTGVGLGATIAIVAGSVLVPGRSRADAIRGADSLVAGIIQP